VRVPEALAVDGELDAFRQLLTKTAGTRGLTPIAVTAVAADRSVSLLIESASTVDDLTTAVQLVEQLVCDVAKDVWPQAADDPTLLPDSVAARRL
jgi:hypothetical protein